MASSNREPLGFAWAYRDLLIALMVVFLAFAAIAITVKKDQMASLFPAGTVIITMHWDPRSNSDQDLWVISPGDAKPVGYSHPADANCNLLRDDLGREKDSESQNFEITVCRRPMAGQWVVDEKSYSVYDGIVPLDGEIKVYIMQKAGMGLKLILDRHVVVGGNGTFATAAHFWLDAAGEVIPGSISADPQIDLYDWNPATDPDLGSHMTTAPAAPTGPYVPGPFQTPH